MTGENLRLFESVERPMLHENRIALRPYQRDAIAAVRREYVLGRRSTLLVMATGLGKAQPLDAKVLTETGWRYIGTVKPGDRVVGPDGCLHRVDGVYPQGVRPIFRVRFTDGAEARCDIEHLWTVSTRHQRHLGRNPRVLTLREILSEGLRDSQGGIRHYIPIGVPHMPILPDRTLPLHPYLLGVLLGDGGLQQHGIKLHTEKDLASSLEWPDGMRSVWYADCGTSGIAASYRISGPPGKTANPVMAALRTLGLAGCGSHDKFIPPRYFLASPSARLDLIRGLLDTDGHITEKGNVEYTTVSHRLALGFASLVRSMGGTARVRSKKTTWTHKGERRHGLAYRMSVAMPGDMNPFRWRQKAQKWSPREKYQPVRGIASVDPLDPAEAVCISLDSEDQLYLTDNYVVTHNTVILGNVVRGVIEKGGRALILAHRKELITQAVEKLDMIGVQAEVERAELRARSVCDPDAVVATVQTLKGERLASWPREHFRLVIVDEAHHAVAGTYKAVLDHFRPTARVLGVTATVDRADGIDLGEVFESIADNDGELDFGMRWGITAPHPGPYLSRLKFVQCAVDVDLRDLAPGRGDFSDDDLEARIAPLAETLANALKQEIGERRTIVFTPGVKSAQGVATALAALGLRAEWSSGDDKDRDQKVREFLAGQTQVFVNCNLACEGFDCPQVSAIGLLRPTKSRMLYAQQVGRGTRLAPDKKDCLLVDFNYLTVKHSLVKPAELFDTPETDDFVLAHASKEIDAEKGEVVDLLEMVERGEDEHKRRQVLRVQAKEREVRYRKVCYDPFAVADVIGMPWRGNRDAVPTNPASEKQAEFLKKMGVVDAERISKRQASKMIDRLLIRRKLGLATFKQTSWCIAKGMDPEAARKMTFDEAKAYLDTVFQRRA